MIVVLVVLGTLTLANVIFGFLIWFRIRNLEEKQAERGHWYRDQSAQARIEREKEEARLRHPSARRGYCACGEVVVDVNEVTHKGLFRHTRRTCTPWASEKPVI